MHTTQPGAGRWGTDKLTPEATTLTSHASLRHVLLVIALIIAHRAESTLAADRPPLVIRHLTFVLESRDLSMHVIQVGGSEQRDELQWMAQQPGERHHGLILDPHLVTHTLEGVADLHLTGSMALEQAIEASDGITAQRAPGWRETDTDTQ